MNSAQKKRLSKLGFSVSVAKVVTTYKVEDDYGNVMYVTDGENGCVEYSSFDSLTDVIVNKIINE